MDAVSMFIDGWMDNENVAYKHNGVLFCYKKEGNPDICNNMDKTSKHYAKWNKLDKDRYHMLTLTCGILKKFYFIEKE